MKILSALLICTALYTPLLASSPDFYPKDMCEETLTPALRKIQKIVTTMEAMRLKLARAGINLEPIEVDEKVARLLSDLESNKRTSESALLQSFLCEDAQELTTFRELAVRKGMRAKKKSSEFLDYWTGLARHLPEVTQEVTEEEEADRKSYRFVMMLSMLGNPSRGLDLLDSIPISVLPLYLNGSLKFNHVLEELEKGGRAFFAQSRMYQEFAEECYNPKARPKSYPQVNFENYAFKAMFSTFVHSSLLALEKQIAQNAFLLY